MKARHFKKLRKKGKWFDCLFRYGWGYNGGEFKYTTRVFALSSKQAAYKCMMRNKIENSSRFSEALETSETFARVIVYPENSRIFKFRRLYK